jgi:uncharacterized protein (UPF0276 family)
MPRLRDGVKPPRIGVSLMPQAMCREAVAPLFAAGAIEAVEWTLDIGFGRALPAWVAAILDAFGPVGRLYGHGTGYSPLSAGRDDRARAWLAAAATAAEAHRYAHVTEHFGFCTGGDVIFGPPLPVPPDAAVLAAGVDRLKRLRDAVAAPVGLENLALALSRDDCLRQGDQLEALLAPVDGILHLDLHNLWTQAVNFGFDPVELARRYPLARARIVHVSGGTWVDGIRRDTHDDAVPDEVLALLRALLPELDVDAVIVERIGAAFRTEADAAVFRSDFERTRAAVASAATKLPGFVKDAQHALACGVEGDGTSAELAAFQARILAILGEEIDGERARERLLADPTCGPYRDWLAFAEPRMLAVAAELVKRWRVVDR